MMEALLVRTKMALRVKTDAYDTEVRDLINSALCDLQIAGVYAERQPDDPLIVRAVITYCRLHFGEPENPELLKKSYDEQKAQLQVASGYTDWGDTLGT